MSMNPTGNETHVNPQSLDDIQAMFPELELVTFVIEGDTIHAIHGGHWGHPKDCVGDCGV